MLYFCLTVSIVVILMIEKAKYELLDFAIEHGRKLCASYRYQWSYLA